VSTEVRVFSLREAKRTEGAPPPVVHALLTETFHQQAWCGTRAQFRHWVRPGTAEQVTCTTCLRRMALGRPQARGARR
jgi:hypothetical protein